MTPQNQSSPPMVTQLGPELGWGAYASGHTSILFKGYIHSGSQTLEGQHAAKQVVDAFAQLNGDESVRYQLNALAGHFSFVLSTPTQHIVSVDRIGSIPLTYALHDGVLHVDDQARRLRDTLGLSTEDVDHDQVLSVVMAGYTTGSATLYRGMRSLRPGEALRVTHEHTSNIRWYVYDAWQTDEGVEHAQELSRLHRMVVERLAASAGDRTICVPLSAGYDSRFVAAGLKEVGASNVKLFSYGQAGNTDAHTAQTLANHLGFPWTFVPFTPKGQASFFADPEHRQALWRTADAATAAPFEQDWPAIKALRQNGYIPEDAIIVNGSTGDFISGGHAPSALMPGQVNEDAQSRSATVFDKYIRKHFALWDQLLTPAAMQRLLPLLSEQVRSSGANFDETDNLFGIYEMLEYENRQSKYVVSGQRTYEAFGLGWRLPLWDDELIAFWSRVPGRLKLGQSLYRSVLQADDWAGAFSSIPVNRKRISPAWIRPIRMAAKLASVPLGRARWHAVEKRFFSWRMDPLLLSAVVPYQTAALDNRGARHAVSWIAERYLQDHGCDTSHLFEDAAS